MKSRFLLVLFGCSLLLSCHSRLEKQLSGIDELLYQYPDSALSELKRIDTLSIHRTKDKAYYALLLSAARDKCYIDVTNDSLITLSADYFANHGSLYNRMRSYYYQGIVRMNAKQYPAAVLSFEKAEQDARAIRDLRYLGLIYRNKGNIYNQTGNFIEAKKNNKQALSCFINNSDSIYAQYLTYSLAVNYLNNTGVHYNTEDLDSCQYHLKDLLTNNSNPTLQAYSRVLYACTLVSKGDSLQKAINLFRSVPRSTLDFQDLAYFALAFAKTGHVDSAKFWMSTAYNVCRTRTEQEVLNSFLFRVDTVEGRYKEALQKLIGAMAVQDSVTRVLLQQSLSIAQKDYYQHEATLKNNQIQRQRLVFSAISIIALLTFLKWHN